MRGQRMRALVLATTMALGMATAAVAAPPDESGVVTRLSLPVGLVYDEDGIYVIGGPPFEQGCRDAGFAEPTWSFVDRGDGGQNVHFTCSGERIMVFEGDYDSIFDLIGEACGAVFDGDPETVPPEPVAVGVGRYAVNERVDPDGTVHGHDSLVGGVRTTDEGKSVHLRAFAKYVVDGSGFHFQQLRVDYGG